MNRITCKDPVDFAFAQFKDLHNLEFFFITDSKKPYQKVPLFHDKVAQGFGGDDKVYNAIELSTGESRFVTAEGCVHPYIANVDLVPQTANQAEEEDSD